MDQARRPRRRAVPLQPANADIDGGMIFTIAVVARHLSGERIARIVAGREKRHLGQGKGVQACEDFAGLRREAGPCPGVAGVVQQGLGQGLAGNGRHREAALQPILGGQFEEGFGYRQAVAVYHLEYAVLIGRRQERRDRRAVGLLAQHQAAPAGRLHQVEQQGAVGCAQGGGLEVGDARGAAEASAHGAVESRCQLGEQGRPGVAHHRRQSG